MKYRNVLFIISMLTLSILRLSAQNKSLVESGRELQHQPLGNFEVVDTTFKDGLIKLAKEIDGNIGFEEVLREKYSDPPNEGPRFSIHLVNANVSGALDALCQHDARYKWVANETTINIYPKETSNDSAYFLNRNIPFVRVQDAPNPDQALFALNNRLPPPSEQFGYIEAGGSNAYDAPWTHSFENITVREFANAIAAHLGRSTLWIFQGSKQERLFTFIRLSATGE